MQTLQYSQVHHSGTARHNSVDGDDGEFGSVEDGDEDAGCPPTKRRRAPRQLCRQFTDKEDDALIKFTSLVFQGGDEKWKNIWCNSGHVDSSATGSLLKQFLQDQIFIYPKSVTQRSWKRREGVVRRSCISIIIP